jgi:hypothetical protein
MSAPQFGVRFVASGKVAGLGSRERAEVYARVWTRLGFEAELVTRLGSTSAWVAVLAAREARKAQLVGGGSR